MNMNVNVKVEFVGRWAWSCVEFSLRAWTLARGGAELS